MPATPRPQFAETHHSLPTMRVAPMPVFVKIARSLPVPSEPDGPM